MGILPQIIIVLPNTETLHSTIKVLWTLWEKQVANLKASLLRASVLVARQSPGNAVRTLMEVGANTLQVKLKLIRVVILKLEN